MPSILIIAYYFPPMGMGGVQRVLKFAKYLPEFGWDVTVITPQVSYYHEQDHSLLDDLPSSIRIERVAHQDRAMSAAARAPFLQSAGVRKFASLLDWPDRHRSFAEKAVASARQLIKEKSFDLVLTTSPPPSIHLAGLALHDNIPWIAEFRDPWQAQLGDYGPAVVHRRHNRDLHQRILAGADAIVTVTPELARHFASMVPALPVTTIRNGYDESDFHGEGEVTSEPALKATINPSHPLTITLPGTFSAFSDPEPILRGIATWRGANPSRNIRIRHVGSTLGIHVTNMTRELGLGDVYDDLGYLAHRESIGELLKAKLIAIAYTDPHVTAVSVPGRIYEALRSQRPMLVVTPPHGALGSLLASVTGSAVVAPNDAPSIPAAIDRLVAGPRTSRSVASIEVHERRSQTTVLSELGLKVIENRRSARP